jgi:toxin ParE1/3/4
VTRFFLTPAAEADLEAIWDYTEEQWGWRQAERYVAAIRDACRSLAAREYPDRYAGDVRPGFRKAAVGSHVLYFLRREDGAPEIIRILHQRMDGPRHLT